MNFLTQALIYLAAAVVCVPVAKKLGMGSVLGYLLAGMIIGPFILGLIGKEGEDIMHFAEFGVVMMLFLIGLELEPSQFWKMRRSIVGMGSMQMILTSALVFILMVILGQTWQISVAIALAFAMSSTAIVLQTIKEKGLSKTAAGQSSFSVLLFQDIMVIPIMAILPLLVIKGLSDSSTIKSSLIGNLPGWLQGLTFIGSVATIYFGGRYIIIPLLRIIARTGLREIFTASSLLLVVAVSLMMQVIGLSPALGAFLAGIVLANSEYRHQLESDLDPFKALLLGLFFIGVGASINFHVILSKPLIIFGLVLCVMTIKFLVLLLTGKIHKVTSSQNLLFAFALSQVGEFSFVLLSFSNQLNIINREWMEILMAVTAITMTITPLLLLINERFIDPKLRIKSKANEFNNEGINERHPVIIAGFGHFGSNIGRFLRANGVEATVLDHDSDRVNILRKMGFNVYYGDATRVSLLKSAGADDARIIIVAMDSSVTNQELINTVQNHFPHLKIMVRAKNRSDAYELIDLGVKDIYRESLHTSVKMAVDVLLQIRTSQIYCYPPGTKFLQYDEETILQMAEYRHDMKQYILKTRESFKLQEELLSKDLIHDSGENDHSWDSENIKETMGKIK